MFLLFIYACWLHFTLSPHHPCPLNIVLLCRTGFRPNLFTEYSLYSKFRPPFLILTFSVQLFYPFGRFPNGLAYLQLTMSASAHTLPITYCPWQFSRLGVSSSWAKSLNLELAWQSGDFLLGKELEAINVLPEAPQGAQTYHYHGDHNHPPSKLLFHMILIVVIQSKSMFFSLLACIWELNYHLMTLLKSLRLCYKCYIAVQLNDAVYTIVLIWYGY